MKRRTWNRRRPRQSSTPATGLRQRRRLIGVVAIVAFAVIAVSAWGIRQWTVPRAPSPVITAGAAPAVAVKPFANTGGNRADDYMAMGFADDLTTRLAALRSVTVLSRSAVSTYLADHRRGAALARDLGVTFVVEGGVQRAGDRLRVSVNLLRANGSVEWGDSYEGSVSDLFALQNEAAEGVASHLDATLSAAERSRLSTPGTRDVQAFADYSQGQLFLERRDTKDGADSAIAAFERAIARAPAFAGAHAALGAAFWAKYEQTNEAAWTARAVGATLEAQRLDPQAAGVLVSLAQIYAGLGRTEEAIAELRRAIALHPNEPEAHRLLGDRAAGKGD